MLNTVLCAFHSFCQFSPHNTSMGLPPHSFYFIDKGSKAQKSSENCSGSSSKPQNLFSTSMLFYPPNRGGDSTLMVKGEKIWNETVLLITGLIFYDGLKPRAQRLLPSY